MAKGIGACRACGDPTYRKGVRGNPPHYCTKPECFKRCSVDGCESPTRAGMCSKHQQRFKRYGDPHFVKQEQSSNAGKSCGVEACALPAVTKGYCDRHYKRFRRHGDPLGGLADNSGLCAVDDCERDAHQRGWCVRHYMRWYKYGDPLALSQMRQFMADDPDRPTCKVEDCDRPYKTLGYCRRHAYRLERYGDPLGSLPREQRECELCGTPVQPGQYKRFCSAACYFAVRNNGGSVPSGAACFVCGDHVPFTWVDSEGKRWFRQRRWCWDCSMRARHRRHAISTEQLERRDGNMCRLCRTPVDMTLTHTDADALMRASVDHIMPISRGGLNVPENCQLAHLRCNLSKNDRTEDELAVRRLADAEKQAREDNPGH